MAPRSNWKGYLKLSLVSASIAIYPATSSSEKVRFNTLNRATGNRLKRQMVDPVTGDVVESDEQIKGYAVGKDQYVTVEGPAVVGETDDDVQRSLAHRYLGPEIGDLYLEAIADTVSRVARLTPTRWRTVDYTPFVERVAGA